MALSVQQQNVLDFVNTGNGNAFVQAVAGAGKTTTLVAACGEMRGSIAFAAYNKKIALEIEQKLQRGGVTAPRVGTFHSFGFGAWRRKFSSVKAGPEAARDKADRMMLDNGVSPAIQATVARLVSLAKQNAAGAPDADWTDMRDAQRWNDVGNHHGVFDEFEDSNDIDESITYAIKCLRWSVSFADKIIDFDDMIYMPLAGRVRMFQNDWLLVDEAQDTNPARRLLAAKMLRDTGRALFVGDVHQAIYGFTGADADSVARIVKDFDCAELPLTVTYRCPKSVVAMAQTVVGHIQAYETAPDGEVVAMTAKDFNRDAVAMLRPTDAILCRNTKPIVAMAFKLLKAGIPCQVEGRDIGKGLIALATKWRSVKNIGALRDRLTAYRDRQYAKLMAAKKELQAEAVMDRVDTLLVICEDCPTVDAVVRKIERMFADLEGSKVQVLTLSTVHKAKGREWPTVYLLGRDKYMPSAYAKRDWEIEQENNIIYVACTRAQEKLVLLEAEA